MFISQPISTAASLFLLSMLGAAPMPVVPGGTGPVSTLGADCHVDGPASACAGQALNYSSQFVGTNYVWHLTANTAGAFFCGPTNQQSVCVNTTQPGLFRLQLDYNLPSGHKSCAAEPLVSPALLIATLAPQSVCRGDDAVFVTGVTSGNGPFTYAWTFDNGVSEVAIPGATTDTLVLTDVDAADAGNYCVTVTNECGGVVSCASLTVRDATVIADLLPQSVCVGADAVFTTSVSAGNGPFSYVWTVDHGAGPVLIPTATTDTLILQGVSANDAGLYCVLVSGDCGFDEACAALTVEACGGDEFCTLTQGAYGNSGGQFNGLSRLDLINSLLTTDLVVGKPGRSLRIQAGNGSCVIARLPANSTPAALPAIGNALLGAATCQTAPVALPLKNTKFKNVFLGQVITLSLNTRLDPDLAGLGICESMTTQLMSVGPDGLHGTADDAPDAGPDGIFGTADDVLTVSISSHVFDALATQGLPLTVGGLLELANRALAAQATPGATLSEINGAVDAINRGFDECRMLIDCTGQ